MDYPNTSETEARRMLEILGNPVVEVRRLANARGSCAVHGYFSDLSLAARVAAQGCKDKFPAKAGTYGVYVTVNQLSEQISDKADNELTTGSATKNDDIGRLRNLVLDIDPKRDVQAGGSVCCTEGERAHASALAKQVQELSAPNGWPEPLVVDSGNGVYVIYRIDLPNAKDDITLLREVLKAFGKLNTKEACIDATSASPAHIFRLAGAPSTPKGNIARIVHTAWHVSFPRHRMTNSCRYHVRNWKSSQGIPNLSRHHMATRWMS